MTEIEQKKILAKCTSHLLGHLKRFLFLDFLKLSYAGIPTSCMSALFNNNTKFSMFTRKKILDLAVQKCSKNKNNIDISAKNHEFQIEI